MRERCPDFGRDESHVDCWSCGVDDCMVPENVFFPTANVFDVVIREYPLATGVLPNEEPHEGMPSDIGNIPF